MKRGLLEHGKKFAWMNSRPAWGKGRIDPQNPFKFTTLAQPVDRHDRQLRHAAALEHEGAAGHGAALGRHEHGLSAKCCSVQASATARPSSRWRWSDLDRLGAWFDDAAAAEYPFPIDAALADEGQRVFTTPCASCHAPGGARTGQVIPIDEVGTDRHRLDTWTAASATAFNAFTNGQPWEFTHFRKTNGMAASLLDGIWLRGPYLHNGSVPSLADLLEPAARRPARFYRGYDVIDPVEGRLRLGRAGGAARRIRVRRHAARQRQRRARVRERRSRPTEKRALLEFMKTL